MALAEAFGLRFSCPGDILITETEAVAFQVVEYGVVSPHSFHRLGVLEDNAFPFENTERSVDVIANECGVASDRRRCLVFVQEDNDARGGVANGELCPPLTLGTRSA